MDFRIVKANYFTQIDADSYWPEDIRWIRDQLRVRIGTPRFIVAVAGKILLHRFGTKAWPEEVYPLIQKLVAEQTSR